MTAHYGGGGLVPLPSRCAMSETGAKEELLFDLKNVLRSCGSVSRDVHA
ncbi:MAG: hypothetical protein LBS92_05595 [Candidatus Methanoplasma sp.]|nr:hypothetical protein [Candidatus Methanoplasma sp.]